MMVTSIKDGLLLSQFATSMKKTKVKFHIFFFSNALFSPFRETAIIEQVEWEVIHKFT